MKSSLPLLLVSFITLAVAIVIINNEFLATHAVAQQSAGGDRDAVQNGSTGEETAAGEDKGKPTIEEARRQAEILHTAMHSTLQIVHHRYYKENESMPLPAATLKDVFAEIEAEERVELRWLAVDGEAMNVDHEPKDAFERAAVKALKSGKKEWAIVEQGRFRRAASIRLTNVCLKCHVPDRKSLEDRTAGLIIAIPIRE